MPKLIHRLPGAALPARSAPATPGTPLVLLLAVALVPATVIACGGGMPHRTLDDRGLLYAPVADFEAELAAVTTAARPVAEAMPPTVDQTVYAQSAEVAVADLEAALRERLVEPAAVEVRLTEYRKYREAVAAFQSLRREHGRRWDTRDEPAPTFKVGNAPAGLPGEFVDYERGAVRYHGGDLDAARGQWMKLLARPADERRYRTVWAAFMIGRSYQKSDPDRAAAWMARVREYTAQRFADSLGLAAASYGWEARAHLDAGRPDRAIELYLLHRATGDPTATASLMFAARDALAGGAEALARCAGSAEARAVVTAYVLGRGGRWGGWGQAQQDGAGVWVAAVEAAGVEGVRGAERLAWMAYHAADFDRARRWAQRADDDSPIALWVRAKLLMRDGELDAAVAMLVRAQRRMPEQAQWPRYGGYDNDMEYGSTTRRAVDEIRAEIGTLQLTAGQYAAALDWLLRSGRYWQDAAYIADQVMTPDELEAFVDARSAPEPPAELGDNATEADRQAHLRHGELAWQHARLHRLLGRRLVRIGRWKHGRDYLDADAAAHLDRYIAAIRAGHDTKRPRDQRADSFWEAAQIAHDHGDKILASELDPDNWGPTFHKYRIIDRRLESQGPLAMASPDEAARVDRHRTHPYQRHHYRYVAADHAWSACALMEDDTDALARRLQDAGMWLAVKDPKAADRFYKAMVHRCGGTELGRDADQLRWFPAWVRRNENRN